MAVTKTDSVKPAETAKKVESTVVAEKKTDMAKKEPVAVEKKETPAKEVTKPAEKVVEKAPEKKTEKKATTSTKTTKKATKPAAEKTVELVVQFAGKEVAYTDLVNRVKDLWKEKGKRESSMKSLNIYVKPEDFKAYYVINDDITGEIDL